jgi:hypothetical protein
MNDDDTNLQRLPGALKFFFLDSLRSFYNQYIYRYSYIKFLPDSKRYKKKKKDNGMSSIRIQLNPNLCKGVFRTNLVTLAIIL